VAKLRPALNTQTNHQLGKSKRAGGFSLVEALVASFLLMLAVSQSMSIFGVTMTALGNSRLRDSLNAAVHADLESVRNEISSWASNSNIDGMISYNPDVQACKTNQLAQKLINDNINNDKLKTVNSISIETSTPLYGSIISRTTKVFSSGSTTPSPGEGNLIDVIYQSNSSSPIKIERRSILSIPAQGWCNYDQGV